MRDQALSGCGDREGRSDVASYAAGVSVVAANTASVASAARIANRFKLPLADGLRQQTRFLLQVSEVELRLYDGQRPHYGPIALDFSRPRYRSRVQAGAQSIGRACRVRGACATPVVDATAGLGGDAMTLALLGYRVTAIERHPAVAALLADGLDRARRVANLADALGRIRLEIQDAIEYLDAAARCADPPPVVYLDPMFDPVGRHALPRKEMQILADLTGPAPRGRDLLSAAQRAASVKVVVKRSTRAGVLGGYPDYCVAGTQIRYDVYLRRER